MKPTQIGLAKHIGYTAPGISKMKKQNPEKFEVLWTGWIAETQLRKICTKLNMPMAQCINMLVSQWLKDNK